MDPTSYGAPPQPLSYANVSPSTGPSSEAAAAFHELGEAAHALASIGESFIMQRGQLNEAQARYEAALNQVHKVREQHAI